MYDLIAAPIHKKEKKNIYIYIDIYIKDLRSQSNSRAIYLRSSSCSTDSVEHQKLHGSNYPGTITV